MRKNTQFLANPGKVSVQHPQHIKNKNKNLDDEWGSLFFRRGEAEFREKKVVK